MVSPLARFSSSMNGPRMASVNQHTAIGFGNTQPVTQQQTFIPSGPVNHTMQPFFGDNSIKPIASQGMYFRGTRIGTQLDVLA